ncbi:MAG: CPBP family intramembrane metalloprotease [Verrucomicrobia bacterium]|nr:MAG: CPBP family intramembrane metalloprotease [Verrucomicrobiota bacterium]
MPNPTVITLQVCFLGALGIFAVGASVKAVAAARRAATDPPPVPAGRVAIWPYVKIDLLWMGFIFLTFYSVSIGSASMAATKAEMPITANGLLQTIAFQALLAGMTAVVMGWRVRPVAWLGLRWPGWRRVLLIAPAGVAAMWLLSGVLAVTGYMKWMEDTLGVEPVQDSVKLLQNNHDPRTLGLMAVAAMLAAPLCEEIVFRGYLYSAAKKFAGPWVAGACSALVFAAAHNSLAPLLPLFSFGCLLVLAYELTGSLWAPVAMHFCLNAATVVVETLIRV